MFVSGPILSSPPIAFAQKLVSGSVAGRGPPSAVATWPTYGPPAPVVHRLITRGAPDRVVVLRGCRSPYAVHMPRARAGCLALPCLASRRARAGLGMHGMDERLSRARESSARFEPHTWTRWGWGVVRQSPSTPSVRISGFAHLRWAGRGTLVAVPRVTGPLTSDFFFTLPLARPPGIPPRPAAAGMADRSFGPSRHPPPCVVFEVASLGVSRGPHVRPASTRTTRSAPPFAGRWAARAGTGAQPSRAPRVGDTRRETVTVCSLVAAGR